MGGIPSCGQWVLFFFILSPLYLYGCATAILTLQVLLSNWDCAENEENRVDNRGCILFHAVYGNVVFLVWVALQRLHNKQLRAIMKKMIVDSKNIILATHSYSP